MGKGLELDWWVQDSGILAAQSTGLGLLGWWVNEGQSRRFLDGGSYHESGAMQR